MTINRKQQMANYLKELMEKQTIDKITIPDITNHLNVNRQTFYYHFQDIYDLLHWTLQQEAVQLLQDKESDLLWNEGILAFLHYLEANKKFVLSTIKSLGVDQFVRFFYGEVFEIINAVIHQIGETVQAHQMEETAQVDDKYAAFLSHFYTISFPLMAVSWIQGEMDLTAEEMIEMMDKTFKDQIYGATHRLPQC